MPKQKQTAGGTAVLESRAPGLSTREALRFAYLVEDLLRAMKSRAPRDRRISALLARAAQLREDLEDRFDGEEGDKAIAEMKAKGEKPIPWEEVKRELGL